MNEKLSDNKIEDINSPESKTSAMSFEIDKNPELENLSNSFEVIASSVKHDQKITSGKLADIKKGLDNLKLDVAGEKMTIEEARNNLDIKIWNEFLDGNFENIGNVKHINKEIAKVLVKKGKWNERVIWLESLVSMDDEVAEILSKFEGDLHLGIVEISDNVAEILSKRKSYRTDLDALTNISDTAAEKLSSIEGKSLDLNGLESISAKVAEYFSRINTEGLLLNGLGSIDDKIAEILSRAKTQHLSLRGLKSISVTTAEQLSHLGKTSLNLNGLKMISDEVAEYLSRIEGSLYLGGLTSISDKTAEHLGKHKGWGLDLLNVRSLSEASKRELSKHKGGSLNIGVSTYMNKYGKRIWP